MRLTNPLLVSQMAQNRPQSLIRQPMDDFIQLPTGIDFRKPGQRAPWDKPKLGGLINSITKARAAHEQQQVLFINTAKMPEYTSLFR